MADSVTRLRAWAISNPVKASVCSLFLFSFCLRLWPLFSINQSWEDAYFYIELARSLSKGRWELLGSFHSKYLPGYPVAVLALHTLCLGLTDWFRSAQAVSAIALSVVPVLCFMVTFDITEDMRAAWAAGLMAALNAFLIVQGGVPFSEAFFAMQGVAVLVLVRRAPILAGAIAGWAAITRHEGLFLALVFFLVLAERREEWKRIFAGLVTMGFIASGWWLFVYYETGHWLFEIYTNEAAQRGPTMGSPQLSFLLLCFPVAGHLVTLFALAGIVTVARERAGRPMLGFFIAYCLLHAWWMFGVERYFVPMVPMVCIAGGCGLLALEKLTKRSWSLVLPGLGLVAGAIHLAGFAPALVEEENDRTQGYAQAILYLKEKPANFSIMAYEAFMAGYHDGRHPVIPSGTVDSAGLMEQLPGLFAQQGLRYVIWSDLYPSDRAKPEFSLAKSFVLKEKVMIRGEARQIEIQVIPEKLIYWTWKYGINAWYLPWREEVELERRAIIFRLALLRQGK